MNVHLNFDVIPNLIKIGSFDLGGDNPPAKIFSENKQKKIPDRFIDSLRFLFEKKKKRRRIPAPYLYLQIFLAQHFVYSQNHWFSAWSETSGSLGHLNKNPARPGSWGRLQFEFLLLPASATFQLFRFFLNWSFSDLGLAFFWSFIQAARRSPLWLG